MSHGRRERERLRRAVLRTWLDGRIAEDEARRMLGVGPDDWPDAVIEDIRQLAENGHRWAAVWCLANDWPEEGD